MVPLVGTVTSPYDKTEEVKFESHLKTLSVLFSGYLLGKLDSLITKILSIDMIIGSQLGSFRLLLFMVSLITSVLITYIYRKYAN